MNIILTLLSIVIFGVAADVKADNHIVSLPEGHTALNISATERVEVEQDLLVASLRVQEKDKDATKVQKSINEMMSDALNIVKKYPAIKVETGQYYVHPDYRYIKKPDGDREQVIDHWRGSQTVTVKSTKAEDILEVTGKIQNMGFMMNGLNYQLSSKKYDDVRDGLMEKAVEALRTRAMRVAKALGKESIDIVEINVDSNPYQPRPVYARAAKAEVMAMAMASDAMHTPSAEAGETTVSMTIHAKAIIK